MQTEQEEMEVDDEEAEEWYGITRAENNDDIATDIDEDTNQTGGEQSEIPRARPPTRANRAEIVLPTISEVRNGPLLWTGSVSKQLNLSYSVLTDLEGPMRPLSGTERARSVHSRPPGLRMPLLSGPQEKVHPKHRSQRTQRPSSNSIAVRRIDRS